MNKDFLKFSCNTGIAFKMIQGKWKIAILRLLERGSVRFGELHRTLSHEVKQGYLAKQLRELERDGLIHREVFNEVPPKVEYSLTEMGREFIPIIHSMESWGEKYRKKLEEFYPDDIVFDSEEIDEKHF